MSSTMMLSTTLRLTTSRLTSLSPATSVTLTSNFHTSSALPSRKHKKLKKSTNAEKEIRLSADPWWIKPDIDPVSPLGVTIHPENPFAEQENKLQV